MLLQPDFSVLQKIHYYNLYIGKESFTMDELIEILEDLVPDVDFETCTTLIDDKLLTSFDILSLVSEIEDQFDVELSPVDLTPANFNSAEALWALIQKYAD